MIESLFDKYNTDRAKCGKIYDELFKNKRESINSMLEIGIGSIDRSTKSR